MIETEIAEDTYYALKSKVLEQENEQLKVELKEANDSITWWHNRYNAIVKQNDETHKKLVKLQQRIDKAIEFINNTLPYCGESLQCDFLRIKEILGDKE